VDTTREALQMNHLLFYCDFRDTDINYLVDYRRKYAALEGNKDREVKRDAQKKVKAATLILQYALGQRATYRDFPLELRVYLKELADEVLMLQ
jgi:hypothetical protein